jgi:hypothetical protein
MAIRVAISSASLPRADLFLVARQTIGTLIAALAKEARTVALPARDALILPWLAIVAAAAVVLALLTKPPMIPVASMPLLPKARVSNVPPI